MNRDSLRAAFTLDTQRLAALRKLFGVQPAEDAGEAEKPAA